METDSGCFGIIEQIVSSADQINQVNKELGGKFYVSLIKKQFAY